MSSFEADVLSQGTALRRVRTYYGRDGIAALRAMEALGRAASEIVFTGMGSSLSAARPAAHRLAPHRPTRVWEAAELLHYGLDAIPADALVVLVSQSGRSVETLAVGEALRRRTGACLVSVTNDPSSPMAVISDVTLPILAGEEATVSTKTWMTTFAVLDAVAETLAAGQGREALATIPDDLPDVIQGIADQRGIASRAAAALAGCDSLVLVARGPALAAADYGALIIKETAGCAAEAMAGGSFRHGPLEIAGPAISLVVLAPQGRTRDLCLRLAVETAQLGSPTWLIGGDAGSLPGETAQLLVTRLPDVPEAFAPLTLSVPLQWLAAELATRRGRQPGVLLRSRKVTDIE